MKYAKELWESLEKKYKLKKVSMKNFIIGKFIEYMMTNYKTVINQEQEM